MSISPTLDFSDILDRRSSGKTPLDSAKQVELRILRIFDRICRHHNLTYFLAYGTMLGAVRHGGFIPWDDDIDIGMPMEDYKRFIEIGVGDLPSDLIFIPPSHSKSRVRFAKIFDRKSFYLDNGARYQDMTAPMGIFIDIFPYQGYRTYYLQTTMTRLVRHADRYILRIGELTFISLWRKWFWAFVRLFICRVYDIIFATSKGSWCTIPKAYGGGFDIYKTSTLYPTSVILFEGYLFPAPADPESYLQVTFGDWQKLPPESERYTHASLIIPDVTNP